MVLCCDLNDFDKILGESMIQFMSYEQDLMYFVFGDVYDVFFDELFMFVIYKENLVCIMVVKGIMCFGMMWLDDLSIFVDWIYDEFYELGLLGLSKDLNKDWFDFDM